MKIINIEMIEAFKRNHATARKPLKLWVNKTEFAIWNNFADIKQTFRSADYANGKVIFNIGGNNYRLIAIVIYELRKVVIKAIMTHAQYDKGNWS